MSTLALRQRVLLKTLKARELDSGDAIEGARLQRVAACTAILRETMLWWRQLGLAKVCPLTVAILKRVGRWPDVLIGFVRGTQGSADVGIQAERFLDYLADDGDDLVAAISRTERALRLSATDGSYRAELFWPCNPGPVLDHCLTGAPLDVQARRSEGFHVLIGRTGACSIDWQADSGYVLEQPELAVAKPTAIRTSDAAQPGS